MAELNDFFTEGKIWIKPNQLEVVHARAGEIAGMLSLGDTASLPDEVLELLNDHYSAINVGAAGRARHQIAEALEPPYDSEKAVQISAQLTQLTELSNAKAAEVYAVDAMLEASFKIQFGSDDEGRA